MELARDGAKIYAPTAESVRWAKVAHALGKGIASDAAAKAKHLRFGGTWFVGVDALPNAQDGSLSGVAFDGPWALDLPCSLPLHPAQLSIIYPDYPKQDAGQSAANHTYRTHRRAAHVDGLLPEGPDKRRYAREFHGYVLGVHLNDCVSAPTVFWKGSHSIMRGALNEVLDSKSVYETDVTDVYKAARNEIFAKCEMIALPAELGGSFLLDRFTLHGTEPWAGLAQSEGRMTAFFRPQLENASDWL